MSPSAKTDSSSAVCRLTVVDAVLQSDPVLHLVAQLASPLQLKIVRKKKNAVPLQLEMTASGENGVVLTQRNAILRSLSGAALHGALDLAPYYFLAGGFSSNSSIAASGSMGSIIQWMSLADSLRNNNKDDGNWGDILQGLDEHLEVNSFLVPTSSQCTLADLDVAVVLWNHADELGGWASFPASVQRWLRQCHASMASYAADASLPETFLQAIRFWFSLPVDLPAEQCPKQKEMRRKHAEISASKDSPCSVAPGQKKQALVIDDSVIVRKTMARALSALGYKAAVAVNGLEGLAEMQNAPFDLVLCDFLMPVMDGLDCVREYRRWEKKHRPGFHQVIVGMSAHASGKDVDRGLSLGMDAYRSKPVSLEHLKQLHQRAHLLAISGTVDRIDTEVHNEINTLDGVHSIERLQNGLNESFDKLDERSEKVCMIASDQPSISKIKKILSAQSWKTVYVSNGEDALCLLKTRNWGAVLIDSELEGLSSIPRITEFRKWEQNNRIHRQNNVLLMHNCYLSPSPETSRQSLVNLPSGIDGAIRKPVNKEEIERVLRTAEEAPLDATAIVTRC